MGKKKGKWVKKRQGMKERKDGTGGLTEVVDSNVLPVFSYFSCFSVITQPKTWLGVRDRGGNLNRIYEYVLKH